MNDVSGSLNSISFSRQGGISSSTEERPSYLSAYRERLQPIILDAYTNDNLASMTRRDLARHVAHMVTAELDGRQHGLNLVDQRNLVTDLLNWLELCVPRPAEQADASDTAKMKPAQPAPADPPASETGGQPAEVAKAKPDLEPHTAEKMATTVQSQPRQGGGNQSPDRADHLRAHGHFRRFPGRSVSSSSPSRAQMPSSTPWCAAGSRASSASCRRRIIIVRIL